ncbi:dipeptide epimerase [candidate division KSB1 bacterium]|nr:dipeptide epimerase [candidate division KSB1 bacterium]
MNLTFHAEVLSLKAVFRVAKSAKEYAENFFIEIEQDGITGWGEAAPSKFYHEDKQTVPLAIEKMRQFLNGDPDFIHTIQESIDKNLNGNYAARAAVNMALYDWIGKKLNLPVWKYLGINPFEKNLFSSYTISIDSLGRLEEKIEKARDFPFLKVKLGTTDDYEIIKCIRRLTDKVIWVDANEGWERAEALEKIKWLESENVAFVEQPLVVADLAGMHWLKAQVNMPLLADESVKTSQDIPKLLGAFDGINIKLMKCGGITEALTMIRLARAYGLQIMLGCFIESSLGISAAAQLAPLCDYIDLDGHLFLQQDPYLGGAIQNGRIMLSEQSGFGVTIKS